jgi:hypothetical protein
MEILCQEGSQFRLRSPAWRKKHLGNEGESLLGTSPKVGSARLAGSVVDHLAVDLDVDEHDHQRALEDLRRDLGDPHTLGDKWRFWRARRRLWREKVVLPARSARW